MQKKIAIASTHWDSVESFFWKTNVEWTCNPYFTKHTTSAEVTHKKFERHFIKTQQLRFGTNSLGFTMQIKSALQFSQHKHLTSEDYPVTSWTFHPTSPPLWHQNRGCLVGNHWIYMFTFPACTKWVIWAFSFAQTQRPATLRVKWT